MSERSVIILLLEERKPFVNIFIDLNAGLYHTNLLVKLQIVNPRIGLTGEKLDNSK